MSRKHREQAVARAYANQDAIDMISDDDWDEYEARLLKGSSSGTTQTSSERKARSPSKSSPHKRKREEEDTSLSSDSDERVPQPPKRTRRNDEGKSGKPFKTKMGLRTDPIDVAALPKPIIDVHGDDSSQSTHSVANQTHVGRGSRTIKSIEIHASTPLSRLSGSSGTKKPSKLGASVDVIDIPRSSPPSSLPLPLPLPLSAQTAPPKHSSPPTAAATSVVPVKEADDAEENILPPRAKPKGKPATAGGSKKAKLVKPEKKKTKKELEAEKRALDLREKKMTRREFIQYLYEEKLKEELENAPVKSLVLKDKIIWYAEPGNAKASDSFDRRRYEMVCVPLSAPPSVFRVIVCPALYSSCSPARSPWSHRCAGL